MTENIIIRTIKEVEFFNTRTALEIFAKERNAYVILSENRIFDIDNLKNYLIENDLNQFAKNEIKNLLNAIDNFLKLYNKRRELPISKKFYHYKNENSWGKVEASGWGNLFYILHRNDKFMKINEMRFKENHTAELIYTSLSASRISTKLNEIKDLFVDIIESENINNKAPQQLDEVKKELHSDIFQHNAFEVFEIYKENKRINVNSRTDLRVIFELLKGDNLLLKTIELKHYINWLNRVYFDGNITELKKQNLNSKPNIVRTNDYNEYKKTTLKQP